MKISVILPIVLLVGVLCFVGGYVARDEGWSTAPVPHPEQPDRQGFRYQGPFVDVDTEDGTVNIGRRSVYQMGWQDGYTGKESRVEEYNRGYHAGQAAQPK